MSSTNVTLASPDEGIINAGKGLDLMKNGEYGLAADLFGSVLSEGSVIDDFLHLWRAESFFWMGENGRSLDDIDIIRERYSDTSAYKGALRLELEILKNDDAVMERYSKYLTEFPGDDEVHLMYASALIDRGLKEDGESILKRLYIDAGDLSEEAAKMIDTVGLSLDERLSRAENFLKKWRFIEAEAELRTAISLASSDRQDDIREKIAYCKFRQKDYISSARMYGDLNSEYMEAVSYLRTDRRKEFISSIETLIKMKDPRAGVLLIALANDKRRKGRYHEAVSILNRAIDRSPFREDALWQIGWTYYISGDHKKASAIFEDLYKKYGSDRYAYWGLRNTEKMTGSATEGFAGLCSDSSYYTFLSCLRAGSGIKKIEKDISGSGFDSPLLHRFSILKSFGFKEEALFELRRLVRSLKEPSEIVLYSKKLKEIGEFKKAISVATMVPYGDDVHDLWYPVAYWDVIKGASKRFSIDPVFVLSIAREESRLDPEARSVAGAMGLMQLMPSTAERLCRKIKCGMSGDDPYLDVETNIVLGSYYLRSLLDHFRSIPVATAAYNAGENAVRRWRSLYTKLEPDEFIEEIPYPETRRYVKKVLTTLFQYSRSVEEGGFDPGIKGSISLSNRLDY